MSDEPDNLTLRMLRRMDEKLDRVISEVVDMKHRLTMVEQQIGHLRSDEQGHYGAIMSRMDRMESRLDRIERRLDLVDAG